MMVPLKVPELSVGHAPFAGDTPREVMISLTVFRKKFSRGYRALVI
jgi:hypothetical protein